VKHVLDEPEDGRKTFIGLFDRIFEDLAAKLEGFEIGCEIVF